MVLDFLIRLLLALVLKLLRRLLLVGHPRSLLLGDLRIVLNILSLALSRKRLRLGGLLEMIILSVEWL